MDENWGMSGNLQIYVENPLFRSFSERETMAFPCFSLFVFGSKKIGCVGRMEIDVVSERVLEEFWLLSQPSYCSLNLEWTSSDSSWDSCQMLAFTCCICYCLSCVLCCIELRCIPIPTGQYLQNFGISRLVWFLKYVAPEHLKRTTQGNVVTTEIKGCHSRQETSWNIHENPGLPTQICCLILSYKFNKNMYNHKMWQDIPVNILSNL